MVETSSYISAISLIAVLSLAIGAGYIYLKPANPSKDIDSKPFPTPGGKIEQATKSFSKNDTERFGKVMLKNASNISQPLKAFEPVFNTDRCNHCQAVTKIILYEPGTLYDKMHYVNNKTGQDTPLRNEKYSLVTPQINTIPQYIGVENKIKVKNNLTGLDEDGVAYNTIESGSVKQTVFIHQSDYIGEIKPAGTYYLMHEADIDGAILIDWQFESNGVQIVEYAFWQGTTPLGCWPFDETGGTKNVSAFDFSGNNWTLQNASNEFFGTVRYVTGKLGNAVNNFTNDGSGNPQYLANHTMPTLGKQSWTIAVWVNQSQAFPINGIIVGSFQNFGGTRGAWALYFQSEKSGQLVFYSVDSGGTETRFPIGGGSANDSMWRRVVLVYDNATRNITSYINGSMSNSTILTANTNYTPSNGGAWDDNISVGSSHSGTSYPSNANTTIDDVSIYNIKWSSADVTTDYNGGVGIACNGVPPDTTPPVVNLINPPNNTLSKNFTWSFNATYTDATALRNVTLFIWNSTSLVNSTESRTVNGTQNTTNITIMLPRADNYTWNYVVTDTSNNRGTNFTNFTIIVDDVLPTVNFTSPAESQGEVIEHPNIVINVTASDLRLANVTIRLYNASGFLNQTNTSTTVPYFINYTGLADGNYSFNVTATDTVNNINWTETRTVKIDTTTAPISYVAPTQTSGVSVGRSFIEINITADLNLPFLDVINITLYNGSKFMINSSQSLSSPFYVNYSSLPNGIYFYNATRKSTLNGNAILPTRNITLSACAYSSGNWNVQCADNCTITSNIVIDAHANVSFIGTGFFRMIGANLTGWEYLKLGQCTIITTQGSTLKGA